MSIAMQLTGGPEAEKSAEFASVFDKFFDCLNVTNFTNGKYSRNAFKSPYYSGRDFRLRVRLSYSLQQTIKLIMNIVVAQGRLSRLFRQMGTKCAKQKWFHKDTKK